MALNVEMVTFDCGDPVRLAEWWAQQFDGETQELIPGEFIAVVRSNGPRLGFKEGRRSDARQEPAAPGFRRG